jgi:hypothetical protein
MRDRSGSVANQVKGSGQRCVPGRRSVSTGWHVPHLRTHHFPRHIGRSGGPLNPVVRNVGWRPEAKPGAQNSLDRPRRPRRAGELAGRGPAGGAFGRASTPAKRRRVCNRKKSGSRDSSLTATRTTSEHTLVCRCSSPEALIRLGLQCELARWASGGDVLVRRAPPPDQETDLRAWEHARPHSPENDETAGRVQSTALPFRHICGGAGSR